MTCDLFIGMCLYACVKVRAQLSPYPVCIPGLELTLSGVVTRAFTHERPCQPFLGTPLVSLTVVGSLEPLFQRAGCNRVPGSTEPPWLGAAGSNPSPATVLGTFPDAGEAVEGRLTVQDRISGLRRLSG